MNPTDLREDAVEPQILAAVQQLLFLERQFGIERGVEHGLETVVVRGPGTGAPTMDMALARWAAEQVGVKVKWLLQRPRVILSGGGAQTRVTQVPPVDPEAWQVPPSPFRPATMEAVIEVLLPAERFGERSADDYAEFDPTPVGTRGLGARNAALGTVLDALGTPAFLATVVDDREIDKMQTGVFVLVSARALLVLGRAGWRG